MPDNTLLVQYLLASIRRSRLVLSDDMETMNCFPLLITTQSNHYGTHLLVATISSVFGITYAMKYNSLSALVYPSMSLLACSATQLYSYYKTKRLTGTIDTLLLLLKQQYILNEETIKFLKLQNDTMDSINNSFISEIISKNNQDFAVTKSKDMLKLLIILQQNLTNLNSDNDITMSPYKDLSEYALDYLHITGGESSMQTIQLLKSHHDMYNLLVSATLTCLGLTVKIFLRSDIKKVKEILYETLPNLVRDIAPILQHQTSEFSELKELELHKEDNFFRYSPNPRSMFLDPAAKLMQHCHMIYDVIRSLLPELEKGEEDTKLLNDCFTISHREIGYVNEYINVLQKMLESRCISLNSVRNVETKNETMVPEATAVVSTVRFDEPEPEREDEEFCLAPRDDDEDDLDSMLESARTHISDFETSELNTRYKSVRSAVMSELRVKLHEVLSKKQKGFVPPIPPPMPVSQELPKVKKIVIPQTVVPPMDLSKAKQLSEAISSIAKGLKRSEETFGDDIIEESEESDD